MLRDPRIRKLTWYGAATLINSILVCTTIVCRPPQMGFGSAAASSVVASGAYLIAVSNEFLSGEALPGLRPLASPDSATSAHRRLFGSSVRNWRGVPRGAI